MRIGHEPQAVHEAFSSTEGNRQLDAVGLCIGHDGRNHPARPMRLGSEQDPRNMARQPEAIHRQHVARADGLEVWPRIRVLLP